MGKSARFVESHAWATSGTALPSRFGLGKSDAWPRFGDARLSEASTGMGHGKGLGQEDREEDERVFFWEGGARERSLRELLVCCRRYRHRT